MIPLNVVICIIVIQCLWNLIATVVLFMEKRGRDKVIENLSYQLREKDVDIRMYKSLIKSQEGADEA